MPDDPRIPYRPVVRIEKRPPAVRGFDAIGTSGLDATELASLNLALARLMEAGLDEHAGKLAIDAAVREWLEPRDAGEADLARLMAWR